MLFLYAYPSSLQGEPPGARRVRTLPSGRGTRDSVHLGFMYAHLIDRFGQECTRRIWAGEELPDEVAQAFFTLLEARELAGQRLLGKHAGPDACIDTVSGRCGQRPAFR